MVVEVHHNLVLLACPGSPAGMLDLLGSMACLFRVTHPQGPTSPADLLRAGATCLPDIAVAAPSLSACVSKSATLAHQATSPVQERWAERNADLVPEAAEGKGSKQGEPVDRARRFLAFSTGPRQCIGQSLARMLHDVGIAMLFGRFTFQLASRVSWLHRDGSRPCCALLLQPVLACLRAATANGWLLLGHCLQASSSQMTALLLL